MRGVLSLLLFLLLILGGLALIQHEDNAVNDNTTGPGLSPGSQCYLVIYTMADDTADYGKITGVAASSKNPGEQLAVSPDPGEPYIHVVVSGNAVLLDTEVGVGGGYSTTYINATSLKGASVKVDIKLYDPDPGAYGIPEHKLLDSFSAELTLCG